MLPSVLFLLRQRNQQTWGQVSPYTHSSGLLNSATFCNRMLQANGFTSNLVEVVDANGIDKQVMLYKPDIVILEAIWCPPAKLVELTGLKRHKGRLWIVRNHSELPFLALEGISVQWLLEYAGIPSVTVSCNSPVATHEVGELLRIRYGRTKDVIYLPNYYFIQQPLPAPKTPDPKWVDVGCFGAIRPLKNHLMQAVAALIYAEGLGKTLRFHVNTTRIEMNADPVLKSLRAVFAVGKHQLVEHGWLTWEQFIALCQQMDLGLQVSFSETFNIVCADLVSQNVPVVTSDEVSWVPSAYHADPTTVIDIVEKMQLASIDGAASQAAALQTYSAASQETWLATLQGLS